MNEESSAGCVADVNESALAPDVDPDGCAKVIEDRVKAVDNMSTDNGMKQHRLRSA
jgi:hypothetical protein